MWYFAEAANKVLDARSASTAQSIAILFIEPPFFIKKAGGYCTSIDWRVKLVPSGFASRESPGMIESKGTKQGEEQ
jgi:hypothetical protein